ncbi:hypothetical protein ADUPG1_012887 [Aduncisulcus paluster]|uniref:Uncharacterized protein n=1 Tax=Aduncisulcus paluster TaxID=2918883 RepID=A0ABQ5K114_9EUKA|nr:hypothetical protein ADUPG1_012887 [Aduncisulcus paluster]
MERRVFLVWSLFFLGILLFSGLIVYGNVFNSNVYRIDLFESTRCHHCRIAKESVIPVIQKWKNVSLNIHSVDDKEEQALFDSMGSDACIPKTLRGTPTAIVGHNAFSGVISLKFLLPFNYFSFKYLDVSDFTVVFLIFGSVCSFAASATIAVAHGTPFTKKIYEARLAEFVAEQKAANNGNEVEEKSDSHASDGGDSVPAESEIAAKDEEEKEDDETVETPEHKDDEEQEKDGEGQEIDPPKEDKAEETADESKDTVQPSSSLDDIKKLDPETLSEKQIADLQKKIAKDWSFTPRRLPFFTTLVLSCAVCINLPIVIGAISSFAEYLSDRFLEPEVGYGVLLLLPKLLAMIFFVAHIASIFVDSARRNKPISRCDRMFWWGYKFAHVRFPQFYDTILISLGMCAVQMLCSFIGTCTVSKLLETISEMMGDKDYNSYGEYHNAAMGFRDILLPAMPSIYERMMSILFKQKGLVVRSILIFIGICIGAIMGDIIVGFVAKPPRVGNVYTTVAGRMGKNISQIALCIFTSILFM